MLARGKPDGYLLFEEDVESRNPDLHFSEISADGAQMRFILLLYHKRQCTDT
jgi:hypothetical protein